MLRHWTLPLASLFLLAAVARAADEPPKTAAITAAEAGPDYALQGEYSGEIEADGETLTIAAQVIALGNGKFRAVGYVGGFPGDGWNGEAKPSVEAQREGEQVVFTSADGPRGVLSAEGIRIETAGGDELGLLKKVERKSPTLGQKPPAGAVVLFADAEDADNWTGAGVAEDGLLLPGITSKEQFGDHTLHMEFLLSFMPQAGGQARSNSGVYLQGRYEVQILDSFGLEGKNNECGGIYEVAAPKVNMCLPPLAWQTYDIDFTAPRFDAAGKKTANAKLTVRHNGVLIHEDVEVPGPTRAAPNKEADSPGPVYIQNHGNPLRFRNVWVVKKES
jgi:hypothetical protein